MKKVLAMCIAAAFIATACDWFKKPDNTVVTPVNDDSLPDLIDTLGDNTTVVGDSTENAGKRI